VSYYLVDHLGSIVQTTNASGAVTLTREYDPWGNALQGSTSAGYAFTGREWDPETNLYYYRARYYDPKLGRFINEDPIGFAGGVNFYAYLGGDPIDRVDPWGLQASRATPSPSPSPNCSQICGKAMASPDPKMTGGGGGIVCFNNQKCACVFGLPPSSQAPFLPGECPEIDEDIIRHEQKHFPESICEPPTGLCRAKFKAPYDPTRNECAHRRESNLYLLTATSSSARCQRVKSFLIAVNERFLHDSCIGR
jgi:RHS repeat-associated protein